MTSGGPAHQGRVRKDQVFIIPRDQHATLLLSAPVIQGLTQCEPLMMTCQTHLENE